MVVTSDDVSSRSKPGYVNVFPVAVWKVYNAQPSRFILVSALNLADCAFRSCSLCSSVIEAQIAMLDLESVAFINW